MSHRRDEKVLLKEKKQHWDKTVPRCRYDLIAIWIGMKVNGLGRGMNRKVYGRGGRPRNLVRWIGTKLVVRGFKISQWRYYSR